MENNCVYYKSSSNMAEIDNKSIDLIVTSPPYFNIKDYSKDGYQTKAHSCPDSTDIGACSNFETYIDSLLVIWKECERVLKPNGKLCINVPLLPMVKKTYNTHYNRDIFDIQSSIQHSILTGTDLFLMDLYVWNRTNSSKKLMFGSYPYPRNFYAQNTIEFITIYVKDGKPSCPDELYKKQSILTQQEWVEFTKQIWNIPIPSKNDIAFGKHPAIMPEEIPYRCIKLFSYVNDTVLDPFAGSGTTLRVAKQLNRNYIGYELYKNYKTIIDAKLETAKRGELLGN